MRASSPIDQEQMPVAVPHVDRPRVASLLGNISWTFGGNIVQLASQLGMLLALTRFTDLATVGRFAFASAVVTPIMLLAQMQLRNLQAVDVGRRFTFADYAAFRAISTGVALAVLLLISFFHSIDVAAIILAVAVSKAIDGMSDVFQGAMQQREYFRQIGISTVLRGVLNGTASVFAIVYFNDLYAAAIALVATGLLVTVAFDLPIWLRLSSEFDFIQASALFSWRPISICKIGITALPLGAATFLAAIEANLPRYFLSIFTDEASLGIYSTIAAFSSLGSVLINAVGQSAAPRLARLKHAGDLLHFRKLVSNLVFVGVAIGTTAIIGAIFFGNLALKFVFGRDESAQLPLLLTLLLASTFTYAHIFIGTALSASNLHVTKSRIQLVTVCASAVLLLLLTPQLGTTGAAASMVGTAALTWFLYTMAVPQITLSKLRTNQ
ncbi:MAG: Membrane protein involved in the export of O-antigen and teichoic acid [Schlesneria sp.]|nr:Membrane protein involved in the export of O-antigen and teichoic acid [Schlesneria sp.]